jgi:hypothetical protein
MIKKIESFNNELKLGNQQAALSVSKELLELEKNNIENHIRYIHLLKSLSLYDSAIEQVIKSLKLFEDNGRLNHFYKMLTVDKTRVDSYFKVRKKVVAGSARNNFKCDVICMASNEGPYMADFIYHYIRNGFSNIFIGVNDSSTDEMLDIIKRISIEYPQVQVVNTNGINIAIDNYSKASFEKIWKVAALNSQSAYALIVDVDEFLTFKSDSFNIENILNSFPQFDCLSIPYIEQNGCDSPFSPTYLAEKPVLNKCSWTKSIVSYSARLLEIKPHIPVFINDKELTVIGPNIENRSPTFKYGSVAVYSDFLEQNTFNCLNFNKHMWIYHIKNRSEIEYSFRCVDPWLGTQTKFYANRRGFYRKQEDNACIHFIASIKQSKTMNEYRRGLKEFISETNISCLIKKSSGRITHDNMLKRLEEFTDRDICNERKLWKQSFFGTRYIDILNQRLSIIEKGHS